VSALQAMYRDIILDHAKHPHGRGLGERFDGEAHHVNPSCGDEVTVRVSLDGDRLAEVTHDGLGCSISAASASVMSDLLTGRPVTEGLLLQQRFADVVSGRLGADEDVEGELGDAVAFAGVARYPMRVKCALLAWMAWKDATARAVDSIGRSTP
jgi:nitrogen fixation NifU-like protein